MCNIAGVERWINKPHPIPKRGSKRSMPGHKLDKQHFSNGKRKILSSKKKHEETVARSRTKKVKSDHVNVIQWEWRLIRCAKVTTRPKVKHFFLTNAVLECVFFCGRMKWNPLWTVKVNSIFFVAPARLLHIAIRSMLPATGIIASSFLPSLIHPLSSPFVHCLDCQ